jgi:hypothetical protein
VDRGIRLGMVVRHGLAKLLDLGAGRPLGQFAQTGLRLFHLLATCLNNYRSLSLPPSACTAANPVSHHPMRNTVSAARMIIRDMISFLPPGVISPA